ncbi:MAG TPA: pilus assembly PilX N-terminal domain-containing protein [Methylococcaceae bacterium]|nr:pilus assembly PilX N-terminal domain-containing protein [Methylococcaceae bacterium]
MSHHPDSFRRISPRSLLHTDYRGQAGSALLVTLIFLVILTVVTILGTRTSILQLRMSGNQQYQMEALQAAQAALDDAKGQVATNLTLLPPTTTTAKTCTSDVTGCTGTITLTTDVPDATVIIFWRSQGPLTMHETIASSGDSFFYTINSVYSETGQGGRAEVNAGFAKSSGSTDTTLHYE